MKIKFLGSDNEVFKDCTEDEVYKAKMQHFGETDDDGFEVACDDQVAFRDDIGDLVCQHISIIKEAFLIVSE